MIVKEKQIEGLLVKEFENRNQLGRDAGKAVAKKIKQLLEKQETVRIIFASAPSQNEFLEELLSDKEIDWSKIEAFQMDEYISLNTEHPQSFATFLRDKLFNHVALGVFHYIQGDVEDVEQECVRYAELLMQKPIDIVCMGIGENTHIAFNEPHIADFNDPYLVKVVDLDDKSRQQQVNDGCFISLDQVPQYAITLTIPVFKAAKNLYCMVPGITKQDAVYKTLKEKVTSKYPSTILRTHDSAVLYIDKESALRWNTAQ